MKNLFLMLLCVTFSIGCYAETFKCVENGKVTLTNIPCQTKATPRGIEDMTAAEIQAEFDKEISEKKAEAAHHQEERERLLSDPSNVPDTRAGLPIAVSTKPKSHSTDWGLVLFLAGIYFLPTIIASGRSHHNSTAIFLLNLFLGWTALGWILAIIWAATAVRPAIPTKTN